MRSSPDRRTRRVSGAGRRGRCIDARSARRRFTRKASCARRTSTSVRARRTSPHASIRTSPAGQPPIPRRSPGAEPASRRPRETLPAAARSPIPISRIRPSAGPPPLSAPPRSAEPPPTSALPRSVEPPPTSARPRSVEPPPMSAPPPSGRRATTSVTARVTPNVTAIVTPRVTPTIAPTAVLTPRVAVVVPTLPYVRYSPNLYPACATPIAAPAANAAASRSRPSIRRQRRLQRTAAAQPERRRLRAATRAGRCNLRYISDQIIAEVDTSQVDDLARRHRLTRVDSQDFPLIGTTIEPVPHHRSAFGRDVRPRTRRRGRRALGPAQFPLCAAGPEIGAGRRRSGAIRAGETSAAAGAHAVARHQRHHRRDRFRHRRHSSGTCRRDRRQF